MNLEDLAHLPADRLKSEVVDAASGYKQAWERLGCVLFEVRRREAWRDWGFRTWEEYCNSLRLEVEQRFIRQWLLVIKRLHLEGQVPLSRLAEAGIAKCAKIAAIATPKNASRLVDRAARITLQKVKDEISEKRNGHSRSQTVTLTIRMTQTQYRRIQQVIRDVETRFLNGKADPARALELICRGFFNDFPKEE